MEGAEGDDARALSETLFVDGVAFVRLDARAAWSEGRRRLDRIDDEQLGKRLEKAVGKRVMTEMTRTTAALGESIGAGGTHRETPSKTTLAERVTSFARGVAAYARLMAADVVDEEDAESVGRFLAAMAPLDEYRASRKGTVDESGDEAPVDPSLAAPTALTSVTNGAAPTPPAA